MVRWGARKMFKVGFWRQQLRKTGTGILELGSQRVPGPWLPWQGSRVRNPLVKSQG